MKRPVWILVVFVLSVVAGAAPAGAQFPLGLVAGAIIGKGLCFRPEADR